VAEQEAVVGRITRQELKSKIDRGDSFLLVETLPEFMYRNRHLPGAINLPPKQLRELAPSVLPDKSAEIVVYCGSPT
jgi:rhodanese-related sulfurtransferase